MNKDDTAFTEEYKPLHIPHKYDPADGWQDRILFCLADLNNGTIAEVSEKIQEYEPGIDYAEIEKHTQQVLISLYDKGLIKAVDDDGHLRYNLSKIQDEHSGKTDV